MEFKFGEVERGRTIFEGIVANYPKRTDLWSIYMDLEESVGDVAVLRFVRVPVGLEHRDVSADMGMGIVALRPVRRRLYERAVQQRWSSKKMKFFLKRFLDFERRHGDAATMEHVKELARAYVAAA